MKSYLSFLIALLIVAFSVSHSRADIVTLKDGTVIEGTVIKDTRAEIVIEINISNIKSTKKIARYKVKSVLIQPIEQPDEDSKPSIETPKSNTSDSSGDSEVEQEESTKPMREIRRRSVTKEKPTLAMTIPITGTLGVETNHKGLRAALEKARTMGINHVIFEINIDWKEKSIDNIGLYYAAEACLEVLEEFSDEIEYYSVISEKCHSTSSVFLAYSNHIFMRPRSTIGSVGVYSDVPSHIPSSIRDIEFESISRLMPKIKVLSEEHKHQFSIFEALMIKKTEAWQLEDGSIVTVKPKGKSKQIDNSTLMFNGNDRELIDAGFAKPYTKLVKEIGDSIGVDNLKIASGLGARMIKPAKAEYVKYEKTYKDTLRGILDAAGNLEVYDPRNIRPENFKIEFRTDDNNRIIYTDGPTPSAMTKNLWRGNANRSLYNCEVILEGLERLRAIADHTLENDIEHLYFPLYFDKKYEDSVIEAQDWITENKLIIPSAMFNKDHGIVGWNMEDFGLINNLYKPNTSP